MLIEGLKLYIQINGLLMAPHKVVYVTDLNRK